jgi:hypothetical protein
MSIRMAAVTVCSIKLLLAETPKGQPRLTSMCLINLEIFTLTSHLW